MGRRPSVESGFGEKQNGGTGTMTSSNPEAFNRAIEQIRDGKLDAMLSEMFGSESTTEAGVPHAGPKRLR